MVAGGGFIVPRRGANRRNWKDVVSVGPVERFVSVQRPGRPRRGKSKKNASTLIGGHIYHTILFYL